MSVRRRESFVVHFYQEADGEIFARITDTVSRRTWILRSAFQLRMLIANSHPDRIWENSII